MKQFIAMLAAATMLLSLCTCGSSPSSGKKAVEDMTAGPAGMNDKAPEAQTEDTPKLYRLGDVITSADGMAELTIDSFSFADYWDLPEKGCGYTPCESPDGSVGMAGDGKTFLFLRGTLTLVGEITEKSEYWIYTLDLDYNNGYKFSGVNWSIDELGVKNTGTNNVVCFEPLIGSNTRVVTAYIEIPETIAADTESPLQFTSKFSSPANSDGTNVVDFSVQLR